MTDTNQIHEDELFRFKQYYKTSAHKLFMLQSVYFSPLIISKCNGMFSCPFSKASIEFEAADHIFPTTMWYGDFFKNIGEELHHLKENSQTIKGNATVRKLASAFTSMSDKHEKCLQQLKEADDLCSEKTKCILALHFFQPLSDGASCIVDRNIGCKKCPLCKESVVVCQKETTFGYNSVWHGQCDILLQHSIVNVSIDSIEGLSFDDLESDLDDLDIDPDMYICSKILEVKTRRSIKRRNQSAFQAIAQTIVNAFVVSGQDKSLYDKFIPSFSANDKTVQILLYNCKLDMLLASGEFPFWNKDGSLCMETVINIWVALNCYLSYSDISKTLLEKTPESKFKDMVGKSYQIYLKDVCRPLELYDKDYERGENKLNVPPQIHGSDSQLIFDFGLKLIEQIQNC